MGSKWWGKHGVLWAEVLWRKALPCSAALRFKFFLLWAEGECSGVFQLQHLSFWSLHAELSLRDATAGASIVVQEGQTAGDTNVANVTSYRWPSPPHRWQHKGLLFVDVPAGSSVSQNSAVHLQSSQNVPALVRCANCLSGLIQTACPTEVSWSHEHKTIPLPSSTSQRASLVRRPLCTILFPFCLLGPCQVAW